MNAHQLVMREPALAMLMGALPQGNNFGFGDDYPGVAYGFGLQSSVDASANMGLPGFGYSPAAALGYGFGEEQFAYGDDGYGYGAEPDYGFGAHRRRHHVRRPPAHPAVAAAAALAHRNPTSTASRTMLLDPNRDSTVKVERYSFSFSPSTNIVLGTASNIPTFTQNPSTSIKGQRVLMNAPCAGFVLVSTLQVANVNVFVGGTEDAFSYNAGAQGVMLDLPRLDPQNRATSAGAYTGVLPVGYTAGNAYQFIITLQGPSTMAGGYGQ
ncbi:MAG TPA: hypothetical protein VF077_09630 [Nitrospiraceae bacterium]